MGNAGFQRLTLVSAFQVVCFFCICLDGYFFFPSSFPPLASSYEARRITYFSGIPERKNLFILLVTKSDLINVRDVTLSLFTFL